LLEVFVEPRNAGEDSRGAHVQYINQDAEVPPQRWTWDLYEGGCRLGSLRAGGCRWCYGAMKALPDAMKPREKGLVKTKPDEAW